MIIGNPIYDRAEEASFFAEFFASFIGNGVYPNPSTGMQVLANSGLSLKIQPGKCFINGYFGLVEDGGEAITIETADSNYNRIDRIVARWDLELRKIIPYVLKGMPASTPVAPELTRNSNIYEIALADVAVKPNATNITQSNITDRRLDASLCGVVTGVVQQVDTTTLFRQYQTWFEEKKQESTDNYQTWFDGFTIPSEEEFTSWFGQMKEQLTEDAAGNLQTQINQIREENIVVSPTEPQTDRRKVWFQNGKNLFDGQYDTGYGYSQETGKRIVLANIYSNKNLIAIPFGATKMCLSKNGIGISVRIFFYDEDKNFITSTAVFENPYIVNIAENTRYCNFQTATSNADNDFTNIQLEVGIDDTIIPTAFEKYIKDSIYIKNNHDIYEELINEDIKHKVDKVAGKGLSTNDFTNTYKTKLDGITTGANKTTIENVLTSTSTANALSAAQGKVLNDKINGTVLYSNANGTTGTVTLNSNKSNFKYIDLFATLDEKEIYVRLVVQTTNTTRLRDSFSENGNQYSFRDELLTISNTIISRNKMAKFTITTSGETALASSTTQFKIKKVVGYK